MRQIIEADNEQFSLHITIKCKGTKTFYICAQDVNANGIRPNSKYAERQINVTEKRNVFLSFPISPRKLLITVVNCADANDKDFEVQTLRAPLTAYNIYIDGEADRFIQLAMHFSQVCGFEHASDKVNGRPFVAADGEFKIKFFNVIHDYATGQPLGTPARIGHKTGNIEAAKVKFDRYTIPMRMMILLHEFSHVYRNPKIGLEIQNEFGADVNGLYFYLGLGFSKIDAICVFANVFLRAQTEGNMKRMRKIMSYIQKFENQEWAQRIQK